MNDSDQISGLNHQFVSRGVENAYRQSLVRRRAGLARGAMAFLALSAPLFLFNDQLVAQLAYWPVGMVGLRLGFLCLSLLAIGLLSFVRRHRSLEIVVFAYALAFYAYLLAAAAMMQEHVVLGSLFELLGLVGLYLSCLLPLAPTLALSLAFSAASLLAGVYLKQYDLHTLASLFVAHIAANLMGLVFASQAHKLSREHYQLRLRLRTQGDALRELSHRDPLTHSFNRRAFEEYLPQYLKCAERAGQSGQAVFVAVLELEGLREVNRRRGHACGDRILADFAALLARSIRPSDGLYRFGVGHFVLVLVYCPETAARERLRDLVAQAASLSPGDDPEPEGAKPLAARVGMTRLAPWDDFDTVIGRAEQALGLAGPEEAIGSLLEPERR